MTISAGFQPEISDTLQLQEGLLFQIFSISPVKLVEVLVEALVEVLHSEAATKFSLMWNESQHSGDFWISCWV